MKKRIIWLWLAICLPVLSLILPLSQGRAQHSPDQLPFSVIINEWSQGNGASREWVELLVIAGPADLRGWDLGDNSPGDLTFADDLLWANVPAGSLIVIYNGSDPDTVLPPDDDQLDDCRLVLPHSSLYFSGSWLAFANSNTSDNPHLRDGDGLTVHDFSTDPGPGSRPGAGQMTAYLGDSAAAVGDDANWNVGSAVSHATPGSGNGEANTNWITQLGCEIGRNGADLHLRKEGPPTITAGGLIQYQFVLSNSGDIPAEGTILTDHLPVGLAYVADDSGYPLQQEVPGTLVWQVGTVATGAAVVFSLTAEVDEQLVGTLVNEAVASTAVTETNLANNVAGSTTTIVNGSVPLVLIDAVYFDTYESGQPDEAVQIRNAGHAPVDVGGWQLNDGGASTAVLPPGTILAPGRALWLTRDGLAFRRQFGFAADFQVSESDPEVDNLAGTWPGFSDNGDEVVLLDGEGGLIDVVVYGAGDTSHPGWFGTAVERFRPSTTFAGKGQILYRRRDPVTGAPVPDSDTAADWAQAIDDPINGRKVRYPGWDLARFFFTERFTETASLTVAIAPDNAYEALVGEINGAQSSINVASLTFENVAIGQALTEAAGRGVAVTMLLEGAPSGGMSDDQRYLCQQLETAGGQCWFMINESGDRIYDRYKFMHAKYLIVDGLRAVISSENLSPNSLPSDDKEDGTWGRRGVLLITDAPSVVTHLQTLFDHDLDPANHVDLLRWTADHPTYDNRYGPPPPGHVPDPESGGVTYTVRYTTPATFQGTFAFEIVQAPENSLRDQDSLLGLIGRAGAGDTVLVQQLSERPYWGATASNPEADPNPRLEAYIDAGRRGARVRLLLDAYFDDRGSPVSNSATCLYVAAVARAEHLRLECALGSPAGLGIHNKMVLAEIDGRGYIHVGSINGTEQSNKGNRELALQVQSDAAYVLLAEMFDHDWPYRLHLPIVFYAYLGPAAHPLISEVLYDPSGPDGAEFVELVNPTNVVVNLSGYGLGDAVEPTDFEDVRRFPEGTVLAPGETLVVAFSAADFRDRFSFNPDFEIDESDPAVPNLIDDPAWGDPAAIFQLGNAGDEVILRDPADNVVDVLVYGTGSYPGVVSYTPLPPANANRSLERYPYWRDTDNCLVDFRERALPNPGQLPD